MTMGYGYRYEHEILTFLCPNLCLLIRLSMVMLIYCLSTVKGNRVTGRVMIGEGCRNGCVDC